MNTGGHRSDSIGYRSVLVLVSVTVALLEGCAQTQSGRFLGSTPPRAGDAVALVTPLAAGENIRPDELQRGEHSSVALVQVRDREQPHVHARYDLTVTLARGTGTLWLGGVPLPMRAGDVAFIPRNTPHYFVNGGTEPAAAIVVFAPAFSGPDQQPVR